jgi:hypothetical protein
VRKLARQAMERSELMAAAVAGDILIKSLGRLRKNLENYGKKW